MAEDAVPVSRVLLTTDSAPDGWKIERILTMIQLTTRIKVTDSGLRSEECQEALDMLADSAPDEANAVIGIRVTSSTLTIEDTVYLYLTYIGTPAIIVELE